MTYSAAANITTLGSISYNQYQIILIYILLDTTLVMNYEYKADRIITHEHGVRPPLLEDPHRCAYQERLGGRHANLQDYDFCVIILFSPVLQFVLLDIRLSEDP